MSQGTQAVDNTAILSVIAERIEYLHSDVGDMKIAMKDLASAIVKLALVEERQGQATIQQERLVRSIDKLEVRIVALELLSPTTKQTNSWVFGAVWSAVCVVGLVALKNLGVL